VKSIQGMIESAKVNEIKNSALQAANDQFSNIHSFAYLGSCAAPTSAETVLMKAESRQGGIMKSARKGLSSSFRNRRGESPESFDPFSSLDNFGSAPNVKEFRTITASSALSRSQPITNSNQTNASLSQLKSDQSAVLHEVVKIVDESSGNSGDGNGDGDGDNKSNNDSIIHNNSNNMSPSSYNDNDTIDFTKYPKLLESRFDEIDSELTVRPTIINPSFPWLKSSQSSLLSPRLSSTITESNQTEMKDAAFDLLDALSRSGALIIDHSSLHVIIASTHCFDDTLMDTVIRGNVNPIERVERSLLIMSSTITNEPVEQLVNQSQLERIASISPMLFLTDN